ncbi:hypothetical protein CRUP_000929 [Coryphaenoides rupestris]|nr:hypothetical protein CRUP_000929 [Coryphaenoides rupestris]
MSWSKPAPSDVFPGSGQPVPSLLELGQEYAARANQAWAEADKAYQSQVSRLEESLEQTKGQLAQVGQERSQSRQKLHILEKELASAQDVMAGLERRMSLQKDTHHQELQHLQEHLQELQWEKGDLGQQVDQLLEDSQRLLQHKTALNQEVTTYRTLLDNDNLRRHTPVCSESPKKRLHHRCSFKSKRHQEQLSHTGVYDQALVPSALIFQWTPSIKSPCIHANVPVDTKIRLIQPNGTEEHFRPQEVHEEVTYAEPLSPPNEQEALCEALVTRRDEKHTDVDNELRASGDTSDSETEAVLEPTLDSNTSDPASEGEPEESIFDQVVFNQEEDASGIHGDGSQLHKVQSEVEDKLYPDGEEMDTWDSVIERKVALQKEHSLEMDTGHGEPEENREPKEPGEQEVTQDNTLADTRPLIRYKSDETDGNTQASHCDESESSDGEDKMEAGETGSGIWSDSKSKRFGTMEDLCEETEEEAEEVDYDMIDAPGDDQHDVVTKGRTMLRTDGNEDREQSQVAMKVDREHSDEETEDLSQLVTPKMYSDVNADYSEDLEDVDRLVELELEGLTTATYSAHFAQHQASKNNQHAAMGISSLEEGSSTVQVTEERFQPRSSGRELYECKDASDEGLTHSEDSEEEGRSWSSGEE